MQYGHPTSSDIGYNCYMYMHAWLPLYPEGQWLYLWTTCIDDERLAVTDVFHLVRSWTIQALIEIFGLKKVWNSIYRL